MKIEKIDAKTDLKIQKSLCITTKSLYTNSNFKRNYLENYNDSEHAVKTKNASFFMIFSNISFFHMVINYWTGPLKKNKILPCTQIQEAWAVIIRKFGNGKN